MSSELDVSEEIKQEIFKLICIPGMEIEEIARKLNLDHKMVSKILADECMKYDLNHGRRLCCK